MTQVRLTCLPVDLLVNSHRAHNNQIENYAQLFPLCKEETHLIAKLPNGDPIETGSVIVSPTGKIREVSSITDFGGKGEGPFNIAINNPEQRIDIKYLEGYELLPKSD